MDSVCVYCGSREGSDPAHREATTTLGRELVARDLTLVYGGGGVGLMGVLATTVLEAGGEVIGVIPEALREREAAPVDLTELVVVDSMHERKRTMFDRAEGFLALPGGIGTVEELFEMVTWAQLGIHDDPVGLLNVAGYYDDLVAFLDGAVEQGYVPADHRDLLTVCDRPGPLLDAVESFDGPSRTEYLDRDGI
jgi:uncharacterized protein (TIGR00730 family)